MKNWRAHYIFKNSERITYLSLRGFVAFPLCPSGEPHPPALGCPPESVRIYVTQLFSYNGFYSVANAVYNLGHPVSRWDNLYFRSSAFDEMSLIQVPRLDDKGYAQKRRPLWLVWVGERFLELAAI